jgi:DNA invertase Pin-like site-specific DNA recombinase
MSKADRGPSRNEADDDDAPRIADDRMIAMQSKRCANAVIADANNHTSDADCLLASSRRRAYQIIIARWRFVMGTKFVAYYRVSTERQGQSGLGLAAQEHSVRAVVGMRGEIAESFREVESGRRDDRPQLLAAIESARRQHAVLICAKVDRLGRRAARVLEILDDAHKSGLEIVFADNPGANMLLLSIMAVIADDEAKKISQRTRDALAAAKERGQHLGGHRDGAFGAAGCGCALIQKNANDFAHKLRLQVRGAIAEGATSLAALADALNREQVETRRGGRWHPTSASRLLHRLGITLPAAA